MWFSCSTITLLLQTQHQLLQIKVYVRLRLYAMHLVAVLRIRSVALVHPTVRGVEAPLTIRDGAADDGGVWHAGMLSRQHDTDMIWCWRGSRLTEEDDETNSAVVRGGEYLKLRRAVLMTGPEIEAKLRRNFTCRNHLLCAAVADGAKRTDAMLTRRSKCTFCNRRENGGGLRIYILRDGSEVAAGGRCSEYLDYLIVTPSAVRRYKTH
jgi:hypothetical protein